MHVGPPLCSAQGCKDGNFTATCYEAPAAFKRVYLIDLATPDQNGFVPKLAYVDLMDIDVSSVSGGLACPGYYCLVHVSDCRI